MPGSIENHHKRPLLPLLFALLSLGMLLGCGDSRYGSVRGTVTLAGEPVADATVAFLPKNDREGQAAFGVTEPDGTYELSTLTPGDGALRGEYHVTITAVDIVRSERAEKLDGEYDSVAVDLIRTPQRESWRIPPRFAVAETSGLEFTVEAGGNTADWALTE